MASPEACSLPVVYAKMKIMVDQHAQENTACRGQKMKKQCKSSKERELGDGEVSPIEIIDIENLPPDTPISLRGHNKKDPILVEQYAEDRELQQMIDFSSLQARSFIDLSGGDELEEMKPNIALKFRKTSIANPSMTEIGHNRKDPILVEQYADDRELQQAIHASILQARSIVDLTEGDEIEEIRPNIGFRFRKTAFSNPSVTEIGQSSMSNSFVTETGEASSSKDPTFTCEICVELKSQSELFNIKGCTHSYCSECMVRYVASKIQENITSIRCPEYNCEGVLEPEFCQSILPPEVFDRWGSALCESLFLGSPKLYCPYKDCSALLLDDEGVVVQESECPYCRRLFCAQCKVPWHSGIDCQEFQKLNENERAREDIMLLKLAKEKKWQRCPKCKAMVERIDGCLFMKCRCGFAFCYNCGFQMTDTSHFCSRCRH